MFDFREFCLINQLITSPKDLKKHNLKLELSKQFKNKKLTNQSETDLVSTELIQ